MGIARPLKLALTGTVLAVVTTLTCAASAQAAPAHPFAGGRVDVQINPVSPRPGDTVEILVTGCKSDKNATAHSEAFVAEAPLGRADGELLGEARISSTVAPGVYSVDVSCDGDPKAGSARVVITGLVDPEPDPEPTKHPKPTAPVRAGGGGTAEDAEQQALAQPADGDAGEDDGAAAGGPVVAPFGVTLLAGGLLAGAVVLAARRRSGDRYGR
jgi:hypothetical protein